MERNPEKRPTIKTLDNNRRTLSIENFQNKTLRPILKMKNDLLVEFFKSYLHEKKIDWSKKNLEQKQELIQNTLTRDHKFKTSPDSIDARLISVVNGCYDTMEKKKYLVFFPPDVKVSYFIDNCKLDTIVFTDHSLGADVINWRLDGVPIVEKNSFKRFLTPGKHKLWVEGTNNGNGCKDTQEYEIDILYPLVADIGLTKKGVCANDSITFFSRNLNASRGPLFTFNFFFN